MDGSIAAVHTQSLIVSCSRVRDGVAPVSTGHGSTVTVFVLPLMLCVLKQPLSSPQHWNKHVGCVCRRTTSVYPCGGIFYLYTWLKRSSRKIHFPSGANCV